MKSKITTVEELKTEIEKIDNLFSSGYENFHEIEVNCRDYHGLDDSHELTLEEYKEFIEYEFCLDEPLDHEMTEIAGRIVGKARGFILEQFKIHKDEYDHDWISMEDLLWCGTSENEQDACKKILEVSEIAKEVVKMHQDGLITISSTHAISLNDSEQ